MGIAKRMADAGIRNAGRVVRYDVIVFGQGAAAAIADRFHIDAFIAGCGIPIIDPQKAADLHGIKRWASLFDPIGREKNDFARPDFLPGLETEIGEGAGFRSHGEPFRLGPDDQGSATPPVTGGINTVLCQKQHGAGALDLFLRLTDAVFKCIGLAYQRRQQFRGVNGPAGGFGKLLVPTIGLLGQRGHICYASDCYQSKGSQVAANDQGLGIAITDDTNSQVAVEFDEIGFELGSEIIALDTVNGADKLAAVPNGHPATLGPQVKVIVNTVKQILDAVVLGNRSKYPTHKSFPPVALMLVMMAGRYQMKS